MTETKYHMSGGVARKCVAREGNCKIGRGKHYSSEEAAYKDNYSNQPPTHSKKYTQTPKNHDRAIKIAGTLGIASVLAGTIGYGVSTAGANTNAESLANSTPYSVSMNQRTEATGHSISGTVTGENLQKSDFKNCTGDMRNDGSTITCKTVDGKFVVTAKSTSYNTGGETIRVNKYGMKSYNPGEIRTRQTTPNTRQKLTDVKVTETSSGVTHSLPTEDFGHHNNTIFLTKGTLN